MTRKLTIKSHIAEILTYFVSITPFIKMLLLIIRTKDDSNNPEWVIADH